MNLDILYLEVEDNRAESVVEVLQVHEYKISRHLARALMLAIDNGEIEFIFAEVGFPDGMNVKLGCGKEDYEVALKKQREILEKYEDYEVCAKLVDYIKAYE
tara:strand:- start:444 stop:749 length:306 start_codon:yes stop_codon:yes gene_type:complete